MQKSSLAKWSFWGGVALLAVVFVLEMALIEHAVTPGSVMVVPTLSVVMVLLLLTGLLLLAVSWGLHWKSTAMSLSPADLRAQLVEVKRHLSEVSEGD